MRSDAKVTIDLHWEMYKKGFSCALDLGKAWEHLVPLTFGEKTVFSLPIEDLLLSHCIHGAKHQWVRLEWICALAGMIRTHPSLDWGRIINKAARSGAERMVLLGLLLAGVLTGSDYPPEIWQKISESSEAQTLAAQICDGLFSEIDECLRVAEKHAFHLKIRERRRDRARYFIYLLQLRLTPTSRDRDSLPLPPLLSFLFYLLRPIRLVRDYGLGPLKYFMRSLLSSR
jgi:hypothetical protein